VVSIAACGEEQGCEYNGESHLPLLDWRSTHQTPASDRAAYVLTMAILALAVGAMVMPTITPRKHTAVMTYVMRMVFGDRAMRGFYHWFEDPQGYPEVTTALNIHG
jgi:hypothetical protein